MFIIADKEFFQQNLAVIDCLPLPTSGHCGNEMETCLGQRAKSCEQLNLADSEYMIHRMHLREQLCLSSDEPLQQFPQEQNIIQIEVDRMCNQFLQIYESNPVQL